jgi:hypothetical protein
MLTLTPDSSQISYIPNSYPISLTSYILFVYLSTKYWFGFGRWARSCLCLGLGSTTYIPKSKLTFVPLGRKLAFLTQKTFFDLVLLGEFLKLKLKNPLYSYPYPNFVLCLVSCRSTVYSSYLILLYYIILYYVCMYNMYVCLTPLLCFTTL